jgi:hypothetical protein
MIFGVTGTTFGALFYTNVDLTYSFASPEQTHCDYTFASQKASEESSNN